MPSALSRSTSKRDDPVHPRFVRIDRRRQMRSNAASSCAKIAIAEMSSTTNPIGPPVGALLAHDLQHAARPAGQIGRHLLLDRRQQALLRFCPTSVHCSTQPNPATSTSSSGKNDSAT